MPTSDPGDAPTFHVVRLVPAVSDLREVTPAPELCPDFRRHTDEELLALLRAIGCTDRESGFR